MERTVKIKTPVRVFPCALDGTGLFDDEQSPLLYMAYSGTVAAKEAEEVARALNAYDALVEACEYAKNALSSAAWEYVKQGVTMPQYKSTAIQRAEMKCRAALALVRGEVE
jgi:hypothetical protein